MTGHLDRRHFLALAVGAATIGLGACALGSEQTLAPPTAPLAFPTVRAATGGLLRVTLHARRASIPIAGRPMPVFAYEGTVPGPTLLVHPGDRLEITLVNELDEPTNLHTHGLYVSPQSPADDIFSSVAPGAQRTYVYDLPDDHPTGTYWYHPHEHEMVAGQLGAGLAGALVVAPGGVADPGPVLVVQDPVGADGSGLATGPTRMTGREGPTVVVNGAAPARLAIAPAGSLIRIVNASPTRFLRIAATGAALKLVGSGTAAVGSPRPTPLTLTPGQRGEVVVVADSSARTAADGGAWLMADSVARGSAPMFSGGARFPLAGLVVDPTLAGSALPEPGTVPGVPGPVTGTRTFTITMGMGGGGMGGGGMGGGGMGFAFDGRPFDPSRTDVRVPAGSVEEWTIQNPTAFDHPFHLHVWPHQIVASSDGVAPAGWYDTTNVPANGWIRIRIAFTRFTGRTVFHCHILDHEDGGMMGVVEVG